MNNSTTQQQAEKDRQALAAYGRFEMAYAKVNDSGVAGSYKTMTIAASCMKAGDRLYVRGPKGWRRTMI